MNSASSSDDPRDLIWQVFQRDRRALSSVAIRWAATELCTTDGGEHRRLLATLVRAEHLHDAFLVELSDAPAELLVLLGRCRGPPRNVSGEA